MAPVVLDNSPAYSCLELLKGIYTSTITQQTKKYIEKYVLLRKLAYTNVLASHLCLLYMVQVEGQRILKQKNIEKLYV